MINVVQSGKVCCIVRLALVVVICKVTLSLIALTVHGIRYCNTGSFLRTSTSITRQLREWSDSSDSI